MIKRLIVTIVIALAFPLVSEAQTTTKLKWDFFGATPAQVATFNQVVKVDGVVIATPPTCLAVGANTTCEVAVGPLSDGNHSFVVSTLFEDVERNMSLSKNFPLTGGNAQPSNPKFTITIIISGT